MDICVIGSGHVGLVTGACFADLGNQVTMVDADPKKIAGLKEGKVWFFEPGLEELVKRGVDQGRIKFTTSIKEGVEKSTVIFICVGTPSRPNGEADLSMVEAVCRDIAGAMRSYRLIVEKSTVPVETGEWVKRTLRLVARKGVPFDVASNPEFLREGQGLQDFMYPDRVVVGVESKRAEQLIRDLYKPIQTSLIITDVKSAELIKHASNSFLALKISFINAISQICDRVGADVLKVSEGMGMDKRIGKSFLEAGVGWGGSCFPKDVAAFITIAEKLGFDFQLLKAASRINIDQKELFVKRIAQVLWNLNRKTIAILGLAFKADTDDMRDAPSIDIIRMLLEEGAKIRAFDPKSMDIAKTMFPDITFAKDVYDAAKGADALVIVTGWNEFKELNFAKIKKLMKDPVIIDGRNIYDPEYVRGLGFRYVGLGRGHATH